MPTCPECDGNGYEGGNRDSEAPCGLCSGSGWYNPVETCSECGEPLSLCVCPTTNN